MANYKTAIPAFLMTAMCLAAPSPVRALPVFAHRYGYSCEVCHTTVPHLNSLGLAFRDRGFSFEGVPPRRVFPIAAKFNLTYSSAKDPTGLPKAMLDELELLAGGHAGKNVSYFVEQYVVDGGRPGDTRDAWAKIDNAVSVRLGQFSLPLPVDVEDERDTLAHYAAYDQTVGSNPFQLFAPRIGVDVSAGDDRRSSIHLVGSAGHDPHSGLPARGVDLMLSGRTSTFGLTLSPYRYDGSRPLGLIDDRFWREGLGIGRDVGDLRLDALVEHGYDTSADGMGRDASSSGGYAQAHWTFSTSVAAVARYDATYDDLSGRAHALTTSVIVRPARNARITFEGIFAPGATTIGGALLFAY